MWGVGNLKLFSRLYSDPFFQLKSDSPFVLLLILLVEIAEQLRHQAGHFHDLLFYFRIVGEHERKFFCKQNFSFLDEIVIGERKDVSLLQDQNHIGNI